MGPIEIKTVWIQTRKHRLAARARSEKLSFGSAFEKVQLGRGASGGREREKRGLLLLLLLQFVTRMRHQRAAALLNGVA
jgi:hypothetical protein